MAGGVPAAQLPFAKEKTMTCRLLAVVALAVGAAVAAAAQRPQPDERQPPGKAQPAVRAATRDGTVVRVEGNKLVLKGRTGKDGTAEETVFTLTPNAKVAQGGRVLAASALTPGRRVRVTVSGAENQVNRVEVLPAKR
jgi:hypothetical protein